jgi:hypothetical protein
MDLPILIETIHRCYKLHDAPRAETVTSASDHALIEHTDEGRAAFERSKMRSVAKNAG